MMSAGVDGDPAVIAAKAAASLGVAQGELAYVLTNQALGDDGGPFSFPLIALALAAIGEGLVAYEVEQSLAAAMGVSDG